MPNTTYSHNTNLSPIASTVIAIITAIPVFVNIVYVIVCFKRLKKNFHYLLVLTLCICDCFLGISLTWFIIASLIDSLRTNITACLFQTFAVSYGLMSSYSIILVICLERYAVVDAMNFGIKKTLDRFKYLAIGGTLAFDFMYTIETVLFTHAEETIEACSSPNLYGDRFGFFVTFMTGGVSVILMLIVAVTTVTSYRIWYLFYRKQRVHPSDTNNLTRFRSQNEVSSEQSVKDSVVAYNAMKTASTTVTSGETVSLTRPSVVALETTHPSKTAHASTSFCDGRLDNSSTSSFGTGMSTKSVNGEMNISTLLDDPEKRKPSNIKVQQLITRMKTERLYGDHEQLLDVKSFKTTTQRKPFKFAAWEFRAFVTSIIIALTTIIFTGPFIISFWIDAFSGTLLPLQSRIWLSVPLVLNSIVNPFLYAWRVPEIRKGLKRAFCC